MLPAAWTHAAGMVELAPLEKAAMPNPKFDHCVIHVSDWECSNAFYRDVLGAELVPAGIRWAYR